MKNILHIALRQMAIYVPQSAQTVEAKKQHLHQDTALFVQNLAQLGYTPAESLLWALNRCTKDYLDQVLAVFREVMNVDKNWTPLVKGWDVPTNEGLIDHIITWVANVAGWSGHRLPCSHVIPGGTFRLERYNGCPFCGTPFVYDAKIFQGQNTSDLKVLTLWQEDKAEEFFRNLLASKTALDATQADSLKILLAHLPLPPAPLSIEMKETKVLVIDTLVELNRAAEAQPLFDGPHDVLRFLWYKHTGFLQVVEPKTIMRRHAFNYKHVNRRQSVPEAATKEAKQKLKLKYSRRYCRIVAQWLNGLSLSPKVACEQMHPKRELWVRMIRALRLPEYAKKPGFESLACLLDCFYRQDYTVWQASADQAFRAKQVDHLLNLYKQRPGLFARQLFALILHFGPESVLAAFLAVSDKVPARLLFTLNSYAKIYFSGSMRPVRPLGGVRKSIPAHPLVRWRGHLERQAYCQAIEDLCLQAVKQRFEAQANPHKTIYIDPLLFYMPVSIGERSEQVQDAPVALMGARFPVLGDNIRLFMQWGAGLAAQHLDMDLSAQIIRPTESYFCSYANLSPVGCLHSGDIRSIPDQVGTAEYIELNLPLLRQVGATKVVFTCNAYSVGSLSPNMVVGWMSNATPMKIDPQTGVAYDPSCVQHQVRITQALTKGLVFGVLDLQDNEIIWLEYPFQGQVVQQLSTGGVDDLLNKLKARLSVGNLLRIKAEAQGLTILDQPTADENYSREWALDTAAVTQLLLE
jgi:hypothetical protein